MKENNIKIAKKCFVWFKTQCPECDSYNFVGTDNDYCEEDENKVNKEVDICICHNCGSEFWVNYHKKLNKEVLKKIPSYTIENVIIEGKDKIDD